MIIQVIVIPSRKEFGFFAKKYLKIGDASNIEILTGQVFLNYVKRVL